MARKHRLCHAGEHTARALALLFFCGGVLAALAANAAGGGIYVCVDAQGRHASADRPVTACRDQTQRVLDASGVTRGVLEPVASPAEQQLQAEERRARALAEFRRQSRERAEAELLIPYPTAAAHDAARSNALEQPQNVIRLAQERIADLEAERAALNEQVVPQDAALAQATPRLAAALQANADAIADQQRLIAAQGAERAAINRRFDDEAARLLAIRRAQISQ